MKPKPQSFTIVRSLLFLALFAGVVCGSRYSPLVVAQDDTKQDEAAAAAPKPNIKVSDKTPAEVFAAVEGKLDSAESLQCRIQQSITLSGQRYLASGKFSSATGNRMRLEYNIYPIRQLKKSDEGMLQVGSSLESTDEMEPTGSLVQVSDGSVLWTYWVNGKDKSLTRRNLQEIADAAAEIPNEQGLLNMQSLGVGGIKSLIAKLQVGMEFGTVTEQSNQGKSFLVLSGRWNENTRTNIFKLPPDESAALPVYIPDYVRVYIDAEHMVPRRIQYLKKHPNPEVKQVRPVFTIDLRDLKPNVELPPETFTFERPETEKGEDLNEVDVTAQVIAGLQQLAGKTPEEPDSGESQPAAGDQ